MYSLVPRLSVQLFFARSKIPLILLRAKKSWTESLGTRLTHAFIWGPNKLYYTTNMRSSNLRIIMGNAIFIRIAFSGGKDFHKVVKWLYLRLVEVVHHRGLNCWDQ